MTVQPNMLTVLRNRDFRRFEISASLATLAAEILTVAVGWMIYDISREPLHLGFVGLVQFLPTLLLVLVTGTVADRYPRHRIIIACLMVEFIAIFGIFLVSRSDNHQIWPILCLIALLGAGRAFYSPAAHALAPNLVKREEISAAIACSTASWQCGAIAGPALGGLLYGVSPTAAFGTALAMIAISIASAFGIRRIDPKRTQDEEMLMAILGGFRYMLREKVVLGATTLDLFAVLLGSTVVLLPIYARDILIGSPWELGLLRAAIGIGALAMALYLGIYPIRRRAGHIMFAAVAVFGLGTIVFGLSTSLYLSVAALALMGGERHDQRLYPRSADPALDAGRGARPRHGGQLRADQRLQRAWQLPRRRVGQLVRTGRRDSGRWSLHPGGDGLVVRVVSEAAPGG